MTNYTIIDLEKDIESITHELAELRAKKGHDYSGTEDTLDNLREFGSFGVLVRIGDKFKRLKHFYEQGELHVKDESIEDTMKDLVNYVNYLLIMYRQEKKASITAVPLKVGDGYKPHAHSMSSEDGEKADLIPSFGGHPIHEKN